MVSEGVAKKCGKQEKCDNVFHNFSSNAANAIHIPVK
jgi:hypothetical protein